MVRRQAAFHSTLVMCVSRSQKPMQSVSVLPPPPGALGAYSLGLLEEPPGDSARLGWVTPPVANCVGNCGESGGIGTSSGRGAAIAGGGVTVSGGGGEGDVPPPEIGKGDDVVTFDVPSFVAVAPAGECVGRGLSAIARRIMSMAAGGRPVLFAPGTSSRRCRVPPGDPEDGWAPGRPAVGACVGCMCEGGVAERWLACPPPRA